ncbi:MAG: hypothetical protein QM790_13235 [Nibricoccus sp.]
MNNVGPSKADITVNLAPISRIAATATHSLAHPASNLRTSRGKSMLRRAR